MLKHNMRASSSACQGLVGVLLLLTTAQIAHAHLDPVFQHSQDEDLHDKYGGQTSDSVDGYSTAPHLGEGDAVPSTIQLGGLQRAPSSQTASQHDETQRSAALNIVSAVLSKNVKGDRALFDAALHAVVGCKRQLDIVFVVDGSGSVSRPNFNTVLSFINDLSSVFTISPVSTLFGVVQFASRVRVEVPLGAQSDAPSLRANVSAIAYMGGGTATWLGIEEGSAQFELRGRPGAAGVADLMIVITDGQSSDIAATIAAANDARAQGITVACVTIGLGNINRQEVAGIVGGNMALAYPIERWSGVNSAAALQNITDIACQTPASIDNLDPVRASLQCNETMFLAFRMKRITPIDIVANITGGMMSMCYSFSARNPTISPKAIVDALAGAQLPLYTYDSTSATACTIAAAGYAAIGSAYPSASLFPLYVSIAPIYSDSSTTCGGDVMIQPSWCGVSVAKDIPLVPGDTAAVIAANATLNTTWVGIGGAQVCSQCPFGMGFLILTNASSQKVCGTRCIGTAQYIDMSGDVPRCVDCDPTCATCIAPGTARACTTCNAAQPALLVNTVDPGLTSPFWQAQDALVSGVGSALSLGVANPFSRVLQSYLPNYFNLTDTGRCVQHCPNGYSTTTGGSCAGMPGQFVGDNTTVGNVVQTQAALLLSFCVPHSMLRPTNHSCSDLASSTIAGVIAGQAAAAVGASPGAIFLRSCFNPVNNTTMIFSYLDGVTPERLLPAANLSASFPRYDSCNCSAIVSFGYLPMVSTSGLISKLAQAYALSSLTLSVAAQLARKYAAQTAAEKFVTIGDSDVCISRNGQLPLLAICDDVVAPTLTVSQLSVDTSPITMCRLAPVPANPSSPGMTTPQSIALGVGALLLVAAAIGLFMYAQWRSRRRRLVQTLLSKRPRSADWRKSNRLFDSENPYSKEEKLAPDLPPHPGQLNVDAHPPTLIAPATASINGDISGSVVNNPLALLRSVVVDPVAMRSADVREEQLELPRLAVASAKVDKRNEENDLMPELRGLSNLTMGESFLEFIAPGSVSLAPHIQGERRQTSHSRSRDRHSRIQEMQQRASRNLVIGQGDIFRETLRTETVVLRHVELPRVDATWKELSSPHSYTAVVGRQVIAEPSSRRGNAMVREEAT